MSVIDEAVKEINRALLDALAAELVQDIEPDEITATMLAEHAGKSVKNAKYLLDRKVFEGEMVSREARYNGHVVKAYKKAPAG
jgi:hypothetical protein